MPANNVFADRHHFHDAVWGPLLFSELERDVIDTPEFQRLFRTSQLGFVDLIYQTANHSRGAHSIGACHAAQLLLHHLRLNTKHGTKGRYASLTITQSESVIIRLGALLHDISHVPLSHDIERKSHRIPLPDGGIKIKSFYGQYDKHDDFISNPLLYTLIFDKSKSVLARLLCHYSPAFYELLQDDATESHLSDFCNLLESAKTSGEWNPSDVLLPTLLFHLLTFEEPDESAKEGEFELVTDFNDTQTTRWGLGPQKIRQRLHQAWYQPFRHDIIGNTLSADLLDYLRRDLPGMGLERGIELQLLRHYVLIHDTERSGFLNWDQADGQKRPAYRCAIDLFDENAAPIELLCSMTCLGC